MHKLCHLLRDVGLRLTISHQTARELPVALVMQSPLVRRRQDYFSCLFWAVVAGPASGADGPMQLPPHHHAHSQRSKEDQCTNRGDFSFEKRL